MIRLVLLLALAVTLAAGCAGTDAQPQSQGLTLDEALAQLDALAAPDGVSEHAFAGLKVAMADSLRASGQTRFASALPVGNSSQVDDLAVTHSGGPQITLDWTYRNQGDYDQNSEANINDLTTLGANLSKNTASSDWDTKAVAADGDRNGEVNISDITPLGANFLGRVDGYVVQATTDPGTESSWAQVSQVVFADGGLEAGSPLWHFSHQLAAPSVTTSFRVRAVNGSEFGPPSNVVSFDPGQLPDITSVTPTGGVEGLDVQFAAVVEGGAPDTYAWDFGGGAAPDTSSEASPTVTLGVAGTYDASLTVANLAGSDTFDFTLTIDPAGTFQIISVSPLTGEVGTDVTFTAVINGAPDGWQWDFGPAANPPNSILESPTVTLVNEGTFNMQLIARDDVGGFEDTFPFSFEVTPSTAPPSIDAVSKDGGGPGNSAQFTATLSGTPPDTYAWDFGGGASPNTSSEASPTVTLGAPGSYNANLTVSNANGSDSFDFTLVVETPPDIWEINEKNGSEGATISLTLWMNPAGGTATSWFWEFDPNGDGSVAADGVLTSTEESPTIKLNDAGIYEVRVTATNAGGSDVYGDDEFVQFFVTPGM